jgi:Transcriptional regulator, AbiEi antitoxin
MTLRDLRGVELLDSTFPLPLDRPFTAADARREGVPRHALTRLVEHGLLRRPLRSVYLATQAGDSIAIRSQCLGLVVPDDCVVCDRHAGWLLGAEMILAPNEHIELRPISVFRPSGKGRLRNGLSDSGERNLIPSDVVEVEGIPVTTPLRTAWDLGRVPFRDSAISGLDAMLRLEAFTKDELVSGVERFRGMRWVTRLRELAPFADGRAASPGESVLRLRWLDCGLPPPEPQVEVWRGDALIAILDIGNRAIGLAAEYDGAEWHSSPRQREHDRIRRDAAEQENWLVLPFIAENVFGRQRDCEALLYQGAKEARRRLGQRIAS